MTQDTNGSALIRVGPAGWQYPDWYGTFYPKRKSRGFDALAYVASYFSVVEINSTFYRPPDPAMCSRWVERTPVDFRFSLKAWREFTHGSASPDAAALSAFKSAVAPLHDEARLAAVLLQFPWSFRDSVPSRSRLEKLITAFAPMPLAIEVRHASWLDDNAHAFLVSLETTVCGIDQPVIGESIPPGHHIDGPAGAYYRLHGRNYREWFNRNAGRDARYDYLYNEDELRSWITTIEKSARDGRAVTVIMNNHFRGQAPANAFELMSMLSGSPVPAPATLRNTFPRLKQSTKAAAAPGGDDESRVETGWLFDDPESVGEEGV